MKNRAFEALEQRSPAMTADRSRSLFDSLAAATELQQHKPAEHYVQYVYHWKHQYADHWKHQESQLTFGGFSDTAHGAALQDLSATVQSYVEELFRRTRQELSLAVTNRLLADAFQQLNRLNEQHAHLLSRVRALEATTRAANALVDSGSDAEIDPDLVKAVAQAFFSDELGISASTNVEDRMVVVELAEDNEDIVAERTPDFYEYVRDKLGATTFRTLNFHFEVTPR